MLSWTTFLSLVYRFLIRAAKAREAERQELIILLRKFNDVCITTEHYVIGIRNGEPHSRERELELSRLWEDLSIDMAFIDETLSTYFDGKSDFWLDPRLWTDEMIANAEFALRMVRKEGNSILKEKLCIQ